MRKPILVDTLIRAMTVAILTPRVCIDGQWMISKPFPLFGLASLPERAYHAWLVLVGKAEAYQYAEDRTGRIGAGE